ncbi:MAG: DNA polymerase III subunit gamma/tau [Bacteroidales bacterium]|nr:DNA polymerase III subunit gamma/tau [Bacteroidales bacterium]
MSQYIVSARKYRPDSFESLIGQDNIARTLKNSILRGQLAHAYLFCGPRGVGKTSAARIFAKTINCSNPSADMEPCGECESCVSFREGRSYCIHELDAASNNGVEDIKALMEQVQIPPQVGRYSVYIIDEVHMLTQSAFNAFLKTLEEPPAHAIFILATTEKHKIIPTILSRCQTYDFNRISVPDIVRNLRSISQKEGITIDDESLHVIAHKADGAMRDALTIFDQTVAFCGTDIHYADVMRNLNVLDYEYSFRLVDAFLSKDHGTALLIFDEILSKGFNALHFISALGSHLRDLLVSRTGGLDVLLDLPDSLKERYREQAARCPLKFIYDALGIISQCEAGYRAATNQRLHIEFALMRMAFLGGFPADAPVAAAPSVQAAPSAPVAAPASAPAPAPAKPAAAPAVAPAPAEAAPAAKEAPAPAPAPEAPAPAPRKRPSKRASGLSLASLMSDEEITVELAPDVETDTPVALPDPEIVLAKWPELAAMYSAQPRLANALANAKLEVRSADGLLTVDFALVNEAQKNWIAEKKLRELEERFQKLMDCPKIRLEPGVIPEEEQEKKIYMPVEKAQDLMSKNAEVSELVKDLALDIR